LEIFLPKNRGDGKGGGMNQAKEVVESSWDGRELGSQLSHDFKDSLRSISLNTDLLLLKLKNQELAQAISLAESTRATAKKLLKLMNGLIDFGVASRAAADEELPMEEVVQEAIAELKNLISERKVQIQISSMGMARMDSLMMKEVWKQLIDNAVRYSPLGSKISIGKDSHKGKPSYFIHNEGSSIPEELRPQLFRSLIRNSEDVQSTGLGLLFCRRVIERHKGEIYLDSETHSDGVCIRFSISSLS
jgi:K+-sensing histidine kinase KdpD